MEQEKRIVTTGGTFLDTAIQNIEDMKAAAQMILDSKLAPSHFYAKDGNNKPDYAKGNVASVILVCTHGHDLGMKPLVALQHIIPVNGLLSVKGDAAKSMIFSSGKLKKGSWKEEHKGSIQSEDLAVTITAAREDNGETLSRTFSVEDAKRAGLWITQQMISGSDGWKHKKSAWYKYPQRMITYRALGFIARDLFPDVMSGTYTTEEAMDIPQDTTMVVATPGGPEIIIPDKDFSQERSNGMTSRAVNKIDKLQEKDPNKLYPATPEESHAAPEPEPQANPERGHKSVMLNGTPGYIPIYDEKELMDMSSKDLMELVDLDSLMVRARDLDPTKNTNKKLRTILLAHYAGDVISIVAKFDPEDGSPAREVPPPQEADNGPNEAENVPEEAKSEPEPEETVPGGNKFNIGVAELDDSGSRSFDVAKTLFEELSNVAGLDNDVYMAKADSIPELQEFKDREEFVFKASKQVIDGLLNSM